MPRASRSRLAFSVVATVISLSLGAIHLRAQAPPPVPVPEALSGSHLAAVPAAKIEIQGIKNAGKVSGRLFRGAQPRAEGYKQLKALGVSIVIDLHNTGEHRAAERSAVQSLGMRYMNIAANPLSGPSDQEVAAFLETLRDNPDQKVFVHCSLGADRTGVMIASYRMAFEHWTPNQAYTEMRAFHFHTPLVPMSRYVRHFPKHFASDPDFSSLRPAVPVPSASRATTSTHPAQDPFGGSTP